MCIYIKPHLYLYFGGEGYKNLLGFLFGYQVSMSSVKDSHQTLLELSDRRPVRNETALRSTTDNESRPTGETGWPIEKAGTLNSLIKQQQKIGTKIFFLNTAHV